jgi:hypothetical protein
VVEPPLVRLAERIGQQLWLVRIDREFSARAKFSGSSFSRSGGEVG